MAARLKLSFIFIQEKCDSSIIQKYEEQVTELHSVIAELNKKLDVHRSRVIVEEEDTLSGLYFVF